ncbi:hypothetical protein LWI29_029558 [Acer saccharum]|uniref:RNase H type-1 domain-containing protein n=1 Tax=Acer saccharum TaxID=4024 RepID=A0AA39V9N0_ACESA|nr:hypothetical protein LWI29_029558 [Acer saccharum]
MGAEVFRLQTGFTPQVAKALAILHGIEFARDMGLVPTKVESDALGVVNLIQGKGIPFFNIWIFFSDIKDLLSSVPIVSISFVTRKVIMVAHSLAKWL